MKSRRSKQAHILCIPILPFLLAYPRCSRHVRQDEVPLAAAGADGGGGRVSIRVLLPPPCRLQAPFQLFRRGPLDPPSLSSVLISSSCSSSSYVSSLSFGGFFLLRLMVKGPDQEADKGGKRRHWATIRGTTNELLDIWWREKKENKKGVKTEGAAALAHATFVCLPPGFCPPPNLRSRPPLGLYVHGRVYSPIHC